MKRRFTLFAIASIAVAALIVTIGIIANTYIKAHLQNNLVQQYASEETAIGGEVGTSLTDKFNGIENTLTAISLDPSVQSLSTSVCNPALKNYYDHLQLGLGNLARVNPSGIFYCTINADTLNTPVSNLGNYVQPLFADPQHKPILSPEVKVPGVNGYVVTMHVPVFNAQHKFLGTIAGAVYVDELASDLFSKVKFAHTGYAAVQDQNGDIIYSHTTTNIGKNYFSPAIQNNFGGGLNQLNNAILAARQGKSQIVSYESNGVRKIASVLPITVLPGHRWIIVVNVPQQEIASIFIRSGLDSAFNVVLIVLAVAIALVVALLLITNYASYRIQLAKDQFISLVSHQLRTPLTAIRLFSEMLANPKVGNLNETQKDYVDKVHLSTIRMIALVGDILNVSRIELHRLKVAAVPTNIGEFIVSQIDGVQPLADEKGVTLKRTVPQETITLPIDPTLYGQVVHNLLTNAIRYSPEVTGVVIVTLEATKKGGCELIVADNGIGIPKNARKKIFSRFYRAENAVRTVGEGTGLGLYLVKMIMTTTGGKIWFEEAKTSSGTEFHVTMTGDGMVTKKKVTP